MSESSSHTTSALHVGMVLGNWLPPEGIGRASRAVEQAGFDELWLAEDCFYAGGIAAASAALTSTDHIPVGVGIFSCMVRHPALLAMELSALARSHPGRFRPGIGLGLAEFLQHMDLLPRSPLSAVRTVVRDVRRLLAGERVTSDDGPFSLTDVELAHHCRESRVPVLIGGMGPKMLRLGGELGDGVVLSILSHAAMSAGPSSRSRWGPRHLLPYPPRSVQLSQSSLCAASMRTGMSRAPTLLSFSQPF